MKNIKKIVLFLFTAMIMISIMACESNQKTPTEYTNANGSYSITLPANWIQDTGVSNNDMLVLYSNEERDIIISKIGRAHV